MITAREAVKITQLSVHPSAPTLILLQRIPLQEGSHPALRHLGRTVESIGYCNPLKTGRHGKRLTCEEGVEVSNAPAWLVNRRRKEQLEFVELTREAFLSNTLVRLKDDFICLV